jgi:hypothetical protein
MHAIAARTTRRPAALRARSAATRSRLGPEPVRQLQRAAGNQTIGRVLRSVRIGGRAVTHLQREIDAAPRPTIRVGARGPLVTELQALLNTAGADPPLAVDGVFGSMTFAAVVRFQATRGLTPDGIVGPHTWSALHGGSTPVTAASAAAAATPTSAGTLIGGVGGGETMPAGFQDASKAGAVATHTSTVVDPQECLRQREACHRCCEDLHPWWRPWEWRERQSCIEECCNLAFVRCLVDGTFPCLCKS